MQPISVATDQMQMSPEHDNNVFIYVFIYLGQITCMPLKHPKIFSLCNMANAKLSN